MRKLLQLTGVAIAIGGLVIASVAFASPLFKQTADIKLTASKAGASSGFKASIASSDTGAPLGKPQALKTLTVTFPKGTRFNFKSTAIKQCTASLLELVGTKGAACPAKSRIGTGTAMANGAPVFPRIPEAATAYAGKGKLIFLIAPSAGVGKTLVLEGTVSANKLTTPVPVLSESGLTIVITELNLSVKKVGSGKQAFVTAGQCGKGKFTVSSRFVYYTGSPVSLSSSSHCGK